MLFSVNQTSIAQFRYGGGLFYGSYLNNPGLDVRAELPLFEGLSIVPLIDISAPRTSSWTFLNSVSVHAHYNFQVADNVIAYPLAGMALKSYLDFDRTGSDRIDHRFNVNAVGGAGAILELGKRFSVFAEGRLEIGSYSQLVATFGALITR